MGLLTNIFVAPTRSPPDPDDEPDLPEGQSLQLKSNTSPELSTLWAIVDAVAWTADRVDGFESVGQSEEGPWLERCPPGPADSLRTIEDTDVDRIARAWAAIDELRGWDAEAACDLIEDLRHLADLSGQQGQSLYNWTCL